jgi:hypothetical protein
LPSWARTSVDQLEAAIGEHTAGIHFFASGDEDASILDLDAVVNSERYSAR